MKKLFVGLLAAALAATLSVTACAADAAQGEQEAISTAISQRATKLIFGDRTRSAGEDRSHAALLAQLDEIVREEHVRAGWTEVPQGPQTAEEVLAIVTETVDPKAAQLAYMDLSQAPEELKDYILSARRHIIYQFSWSGDSEEAGIHYGSDDNAAERCFSIAPRFSQLFPGWYEPNLDLELPDWKDAPIDATSNMEVPKAEYPVATSQSQVTPRETVYKAYDTALSKPSSSSNASQTVHPYQAR